MTHSDTLAVRTLVTMARQRLGLDEPRCLAVLGVSAAGATIDATLHHVLARHGLTALKFNVLVVLSALEPSPVAPADLAHYTGFSRSSVSTALSELQDRGCLITGRNLQDRRSIDALLTDEGRRVVDSAVPDYLGALGTLATLFAADDADRLTRLSDRLVAASAPRPAPLSEPTPS